MRLITKSAARGSTRIKTSESGLCFVATCLQVSEAAFNDMEVTPFDEDGWLCGVNRPWTGRVLDSAVG